MIGATTGHLGAQLLAWRLWHGAALVMALMPAIFVFAHRSSPLILSIATALALGASFVENRLAAVWADVRAAWRTPVGLAASGFIAWAAASVAWSEARGTSLFMLGEFLLPIAAALVLAVTLPRRMPRAAPTVLVCATAFACVVVNFELATDTAWRRWLGVRFDPFIFNRPVLTFLTVSVPVLWLLSRTGQRRAAALLTALLAGTALSSNSGAAVLGLTVGAATYALARWAAPRNAVATAGGLLLAAIALAPVTGDLLHGVLPTRVHDAMASANSRARVDIYRTFGAATALHPMAGAGFGVSPRYGDTTAAARLPPHLREMASVGHPHNAALQIWVELGLIGALLAAVVAGLVLRGLAGLPPRRLAPRLALMVGAAAVALVGHGAWQGWWAAALGAAVVWFRFADRVLGEAPPAAGA